MEAEPSEPKRKRSAGAQSAPEAAGAQNTAVKPSEKKRRRSQTAEETESGVPSKVRKTSESGEKQKVLATAGK